MNESDSQHLGKVRSQADFFFPMSNQCHLFGEKYPYLNSVFWGAPDSKRKKERKQPVINTSINMFWFVLISLPSVNSKHYQMELALAIT